MVVDRGRAGILSDPEMSGVQQPLPVRPEILNLIYMWKLSGTRSKLAQSMIR